MKKMLFVLLCLPIVSYSQDSPLTYECVLKFDSMSKDQIFDKVLVWCNRAFDYSKAAITVQERQTGIIAGKANYENDYKIPFKNDSVHAIDKYVIQFYDYYFDWTIQVKDNKLRFSLNNLEVEEGGNDDRYAVMVNDNAPSPAMMQKKEKAELYWQCSKKYFISNMDKLMQSLHESVAKNNSDF